MCGVGDRVGWSPGLYYVQEVIMSWIHQSGCDRNHVDWVKEEAMYVLVTESVPR